MAFNSRVFRVLIASPSDVDEERELIVRTIQEWNDLHSYTRGIVLLPLRWETHTAPEYGTRPQEVINLMIVDECDLVIGVFWTRIGTPTGKADSGTLEEIDRVAKAGKPVMLYFSKVPIDPDNLNLDQVDKLKAFKKLTYGNALVESYKSIIEFRDKLSKQLEMKVRELQKADEGGRPPPLSLEFLSVDSGELSGNTIEHSVDFLEITDAEVVLASAEAKGMGDDINEVVAKRIRRDTTLPIVLAIRNKGVSAIHNVYIQVSIRASPASVELTTVPPDEISMNYYVGSVRVSEFSTKLARLKKDDLMKTDDGCSFSLEWVAVQPQRTRVVEPAVFVSVRSKTVVHVDAKVFADSFPEPVLLSATMQINVRPHCLRMAELITPSILAGMRKARTVNLPGSWNSTSIGMAPHEFSISSVVEQNVESARADQKKAQREVKASSEPAPDAKNEPKNPRRAKRSTGG